MSTQSNTSSSGVGIPTVLVIVFVVLKLAKVGSFAHWSWWWVFSPWWICILAVMGIIIAALCCWGLWSFIGRPVFGWFGEAARERRKKKLQQRRNNGLDKWKAKG